MSLIPLDDRDGEIWYNGRMTPWRDARLHVLTHGLHYASSVFEGMRAYNGVIFELRAHSERLQRSAQLLDFEIPWSVEEIDEACRQVLAASGLKDAYLRPVAWRGSESISVSARNAGINLAIACWEWPSYFSLEARMRGIRLQTSRWRRPAPETAPVHSKAAGLYMICTLSKHAAERNGYEDALMLDWRGYVAEATGANIFFLMPDGRLHTPTPDCFLNGITRRHVMALAARNGYEVVERHIQPGEITAAQEVFLTGTAAEITPVGGIDEARFTPGDCCKTLMEAYHRETHGDAARAAA